MEATCRCGLHALVMKRNTQQTNSQLKTDTRRCKHASTGRMPKPAPRNQSSSFIQPQPYDKPAHPIARSAHRSLYSTEPQRRLTPAQLQHVQPSNTEAPAPTLCMKFISMPYCLVSAQQKPAVPSTEQPWTYLLRNNQSQPHVRNVHHH